jgi:hypothetical protein
VASPPVAQAVRVKLDYTQRDGFLAGSRFFLSYSGSAPTGANCATLAGDVETAWLADLAPLIDDDFALTEVDVLDLSSDSGASGFWTGSEYGTRDGDVLTANVANNVEFNIARRYRGGKPRMYLPPGVQGDLSDNRSWNSDFESATHSGVTAFFAALEALTIGAMGTLAHVNISFYHGVWTTSPPWRGPGFKYPPKYRDTALLDVVTGYAQKVVVGSQRRRRSSTTA